MKDIWTSLTIATPLWEIKCFKRKEGDVDLSGRNCSSSQGSEFKSCSVTYLLTSLSLTVFICESRTWDQPILLEPSNTLGLWVWLVLVRFAVWSFLCVGMMVCLIWGGKVGCRGSGRNWRSDWGGQPVAFLTWVCQPLRDRELGL